MRLFRRRPKAYCLYNPIQNLIHTPPFTIHQQTPKALAYHRLPFKGGDPDLVAAEAAFDVLTNLTPPIVDDMCDGI